MYLALGILMFALAGMCGWIALHGAENNITSFQDAVNTLATQMKSVVSENG